MRTTVTLDPDVEALIRAAMRRNDRSFKETLNSAIRMALGMRPPENRRFQQKTYSLGPEQNFRWDKALTAADALEDEELARKLSVSK